MNLILNLSQQTLKQSEQNNLEFKEHNLVAIDAFKDLYFNKISIFYDNVKQFQKKLILKLYRILKQEVFNNYQGKLEINFTLVSQQSTVEMVKVMQIIGFHMQSQQFCFIKKQSLKSKPFKLEKLEQKTNLIKNAKSKVQLINQIDLLKQDNLQPKVQEICDTRKKACANCNCGRKELENKQGIEGAKKAIQNGQIISKCGSCFLGDAFRCEKCPYRGLPAFKPGQQKELFKQIQGKIKLQL